MIDNDIKPGVHVRHYKGGEYVIVGKGVMEIDLTPIIAYRKINDHTLWIRPYAEFIDGRFVRIEGELG